MVELIIEGQVLIKFVLINCQVSSENENQNNFNGSTAISGQSQIADNVKTNIQSVESEQYRKSRSS